MIKRKIDVGVYKLLNSFYCLKWFCVIKKNSESLHVVYSLKLLNKVTIAHSELSPATEELAIYFVRWAYNEILDLYIRYNEWVFIESSQDLTTFQTSFKTLKLVTLPMK